MVTILSLWLAILLSSVFVWIASALLWTVLPNHKKDYRGLPDEEAARKALKPQNLKTGQYYLPFVTDMKQMKDEKTVEKFEEGPVAYLASRFLSVGTEYLTVFRLTGTVTFMAYGLAYIQDSIWFGKPWSSTFKQLFDALVYALLTAGTFGWLWPS